MKKLSKRQKLIGGIAIILIAVILTIVITTNIVKNNNQVASEGYSATTANAGSSLVASYIKKGITIGGITGTLETLDTSDASAYAEDIAYGKVAYARGERIVGTRIDEDIVLNLQDVYYADLDSSGEISVDGVIFADLAGEEESGEYGANGIYTIPSETGLKQYYIKGEYTDEHFGTGKVIAPMEGTSGNERFYVMALEDINPGTYYCWYDAAYGKLDKIVSSSDNDFGQGRENTEYVNEKWNDPNLPWGAHNDGSTYDDMWSVIQDEIADGWFVPSKSEWATFGAAFGITRSNYSSTFGLSSTYWSSSQNNTNNAYNANFNNGNINNNVNNNYVRLATSFIILNKMSFFFERHFYKGRYMEDKITFEELYEAYILCLKNRKRKIGTFNFVNDSICENLITLLDELNNRTYVPRQSNCYVITDPALREIYVSTIYR